MRKLVESTFVSLDGSISTRRPGARPTGTTSTPPTRRSSCSPRTRSSSGVPRTRASPRRGPPERRRLHRPHQRDAEAHRLPQAPRGGWNAAVLPGDAAEAIAGLKDEEGGDLLKFGTGELDRTLLEHGLLDELHLWVFPVLVGGGRRLIEGIPTTHLELVDTTRFGSGVVVNTYTPK